MEVCLLKGYPNLTGTIISKTHIPLTINRTGLKESPETTNLLRDVHSLAVIFLSEKNKTMLNYSDKQQIKFFLRTDYKIFKNHKVFSNTSGRNMSIDQLKNSKTVVIGTRGGHLSDSLTQRGYDVIDNYTYNTVLEFGVTLMKESLEELGRKENLIKDHTQWPLDIFRNLRKHPKYVIRNLNL